MFWVGNMPMKAWMLAGIALVLSAAFSTMPATAEKITWLTYHIPPLMIEKGEKRGMGFVDKTLTYFKRRLPGFRHEIVENVNIVRTFDLMKTEDGICAPGILKSAEREKFVRYSKPAYFIMGNHLIVRRDKLAMLKPRLSDGVADFGRLVQDPGLVGVFVAGRVYGSSVTRALAKIGETKHIVTALRAPSVFKQLKAGWVDYTVGYPTEVPFHLSAKTLASGDFLYFPIQGMTEVTLGYFGCSDKPHGRKIIAAINRLIDNAGSKPEWVRYTKNGLMKRRKSCLPGSWKGRTPGGDPGFWTRRSGAVGFFNAAG